MAAAPDDFGNFDFLEYLPNTLKIIMEPFDEDQLMEEILQPLEPNIPEIITNNENRQVKMQEMAPAEIGPEFETITNKKNTQNRQENIVDVNQFIVSMQKVNTVRSTKRDMNNVHRWLWTHKKESRMIENLIPSLLNDYFAEMYISIRCVNGKDYEPQSLDALKNSIERYLKEKKYPVSLRDRPFDTSNAALKAKKCQLKKLGKGCKPNAATALNQDDENLMLEKGVLGSCTPEALQFSLFYHFGKMFGLRGRDEQRKLHFGDIHLKCDSAGTEFLEYMERDSKTFDGSKSDDFRSTRPRIFSSGGQTDRNPVELYKKYIVRRPTEMNQPDAPFYLQVKTEKKMKQDEETWYYPRPLGSNTLGKLMKSAADTAGIDHKRLTNHSVRKTCVSTLSKAGVPPNKIMQVTGHKNIASITAYDTALSVDEQKSISGVLLHQQSIPPALPNIPSSTSSIGGRATIIENLQLDTAIFQSVKSENTAQSSVGRLFCGAVIQNMNITINQK